ncbi:MAG: AAA family ATPase [Acidobacteriota bacterium]|nr:AAA family ATPase [Acidobacteriota bacterium]
MAGRHADPTRVYSRDDLAQELSMLRSQSELTVRDVARKVGSPTATIGDYFAGRHLPGPRQLPLFRSLLEACGVSDPAEVESWMEALVRVRQSSDGRVPKQVSPYMGLEPYRPADADRFFGRKRSLEDLLQCLARLTSSDPPGGLAVLIGPSGSGKSSLVSAALLPAVASGSLDTAARSWKATVIGHDQLGEPARIEGGRATLLIVDQFEQILSADDSARAASLDHLAARCRETAVLVVLRSDFYEAAAAEPLILSALRQHQVLLGPMTPDEVREAIVGPARRVGAVIEDGLVEVVLADLGPRQRPGAAHGPGGLPLMSYALLATWQRAGRNQLTVGDYLAVGGLRGAVLRAAEELYQALDPTERDVARRLFGRLVRVDSENPPTSRRASRSDLIDTGDPDLDVIAEQVLERFIAARLLTGDTETVHVSHEALLGAWPRLADWIESDREWLNLNRQIQEAAQVWDDHGRDTSLLWRGARLEAAEQAVGEGREMNRLENAFVVESLTQIEKEHRLERRRTHRTQQLLVLVAILAASAFVLAGVAVASRGTAVRARDDALSRQVAIESGQLRTRSPSLAAQLAVAAYRIAPTVQARSALLDATAGDVPFRLLGPAGPLFISLSSSGRILAVAQSGNDTVALYAVKPPGATHLVDLSVGARTDQDFAVAVSPDGTVLAAGGTSGQVTLWDTADPAHPAKVATVGHPGSTVYSLAFSPDGRSLAEASSDGTLQLWSLGADHHPAAAAKWRSPGGDALKAVAYTPAGAVVAAGSGGTVVVWNTAEPSPVPIPGTGAATYQTVSVSADGKLLAAGATDDTTHVWYLTGANSLQPAHAPLDDGTSEVDSTAFDPSGTTLATGTAAGQVRLFDTSSWDPAGTLDQSDPVTALAYTADGKTLVSADSGGHTRLWSLPLQATLSEPGTVYSLDYADSGRYLYATSDSSHSDVTVWDTADSLQPTQAASVEMPAGLGPVAGSGAVSPNGKLLAAANRSALVQLFALPKPSVAVAAGPPLHDAKPTVEQLGFTPNSRVMIGGDDGGELLLWDVTNPATARLLAVRTDTKGEVLGFAVSPDGRLLADAATDAKVRIYDISDPAKPVLLSTVGGFSNYAYTTAFTPDGRTLIAGSADGTVRLWNVTDPSRPAPLGAPLSGPSGYVFNIAVSPDGKTLAAASTDHSVWVWDIADVSRPVHLDTLTAPQDTALVVTFAPGNQVLASSGGDDLLHLWDYQPSTAMSRLCSAAGQAITRAEWAKYVQGLPYRAPCR